MRIPKKIYDPIAYAILIIAAFGIMALIFGTGYVIGEIHAYSTPQCLEH